MTNQFRAMPGGLERKAGGDGRTVYGIAVPWDTVIDVYGDGSLRELFRRGAADHQMTDLRRIKVSGGHMYRGGEAIGVTTVLRNDAAGLYWEGRISRTPAGDHALTLAMDGVLDQLSVGFREVPGGSPVIGGIVERRKIDLFEVALVAEGAYGKGAELAGVRSGQPAGTLSPVHAEAAAIMAEIELRHTLEREAARQRRAAEAERERRLDEDARRLIWALQNDNRRIL